MDNDEKEDLPPFVSPPGTRLPTSRQESKPEPKAEPEPQQEQLTAHEEPAPPPPVLEELTGPVEAAQPVPTEPAEAGALPVEWLGPLNNRFIIAAASVLVLFALISLVLFVFSRGDSGPGGGARVAASGDDATPTPELNLTAVARNTTSVFNGPGDNYAPLGTIRSGVRVDVVGRNEDDTWLQVTYPPGSSLQGWVDITSFDVTGDISTLDIAGPGSYPDIVVPTSVVVVEPTDTPRATNTPTRTNTPRPRGTEAPTRTPQPSATSVFATLTPDESGSQDGLTIPGTLTPPATSR